MANIKRPLPVKTNVEMFRFPFTIPTGTRLVLIQVNIKRVLMIIGNRLLTDTGNARLFNWAVTSISTEVRPGNGMYLTTVNEASMNYFSRNSNHDDLPYRYVHMEKC